MKNLIATALLASAAIAGTAQAMTAPAVPHEARLLVPGADFSNLSSADIYAVINILHGSGGVGEKQAAIRSLLN